MNVDAHAHLRLHRSRHRDLARRASHDRQGSRLVRAVRARRVGARSG